MLIVVYTIHYDLINVHYDAIIVHYGDIVQHGTLKHRSEINFYLKVGVFVYLVNIVKIYSQMMCDMLMLQYGTTPLIWASRKGHNDIVELLLLGGANVDNSGMVGIFCVVHSSLYVDCMVISMCGVMGHIFLCA